MAPSQERRKKTKKEKRELVLRLFRNHGKEDKEAKEAKENKETKATEQKTPPGIFMTTGPTSGSQPKKDSGSLKPIEQETDEHLAHTVFENIKNSKPAVVNEKTSTLKWKDGAAPPEETKDKEVEATKTSDGATSAKEEEVNNDEDQPTVFEEIEGGHKPAAVNQKPAQLQWKKNKTPEKNERTDKTDVDEVQGEEGDQTAPADDKPKGPIRDENFMIACKLMIQIRQCNILENILMDVENSILRSFFEEQMEHPTNAVIELLHKAIDLCYEKIVFHGDQYDIYLDAEAYIFIKNKDMAKSKCMDALMTVPDCLPLRWGGKKIGLQLCEDLEAANQIVTQANNEVKLSKSKMMAPTEGENGWTPMLKEAAEAQNTKDTEGADDKSNSDKDKIKEVKKPRKKRILNISMREAADARKENEMREERDRLIAARKVEVEVSERREAQLAIRPMIAPAPVSNKAMASPNKKPAIPPGVIIQPAPKNRPIRKAQTNGVQGAPVAQGTSKKIVKTPQEQEAQRKGLTNYFRAIPSKPPPKKK